VRGAVQFSRKGPVDSQSCTKASTSLYFPCPAVLHAPITEITGVMTSWGANPSASFTTPSQSSSMYSAWPPFRLPSDYLPHSWGTAGPSRAANMDILTAPKVVASTPATASVLPGLARSVTTTLNAVSASHTPNQQVAKAASYQPPYNVGAQPHAGLPLESYFMAHLQFPKTCVHLWDRVPLREPETLLSSVCIKLSLLKLCRWLLYQRGF
jgi:hypothetical protein